MAGFIYIMSNKAFKDNLIKIGKTDRDPSVRRGELYTTGTPDEFNLEYYAYVNNHHETEIRIHFELQKYRYSNRREFFDCEISTAIMATRSICADSMKFEEVFYKDVAEIEKIQKKEQAAKAREDERLSEEKKSTECKKLLESYLSELMNTVKAESDRHYLIRKSRSITSKIIEAIPTFDKSMRLNIDEKAEAIKNEYYKIVENKHCQLVKIYSNTNHRNDQIRSITEKDHRALRYTLRQKYAHIGGEYGNDYSIIYWGLVNKNGKLEGICHVKHIKSSIEEQGKFIDANRDGEFITRQSNGLLSLQCYKNNIMVSTKNIDQDELDFKN